MTLLSPPRGSAADAEGGDAGHDRTWLLLGAFLVCQLFVPSTFVVKGLGSFGTPANIVGVICLAVWLRSLLKGQISFPPVLPRVFIALFLITSFISAAASSQRPVDALESRAILRWFIISAALSGVVLLTSERIRTRCDLNRLITFLIWCAAVVSLIAAIQFLYGLDLAPLFRGIPVLRENAIYDSYIERANFRRVAATADHPIELGFFLALVLPLAIHRAVARVSNRFVAVLHVALILLAMSLTLSRSALIEAAVTVLAVLPALSKAARRAVPSGCVLVVALFRLAQPKLSSVLVGLFTGAGTDTSVTHRTSEYEKVATYFKDYPWFGRGPGTFLPERYITLDNQYLLSLLEVGIVGLVALCLLFAFGLRNSLRAAELFTVPALRLEARCLATCFMVSAIGFAFFDAMSFPLGRGILFFLLGMSGVERRLAEVQRAVWSPTSAAGSSPSAVAQAQPVPILR